MNSSGTVKGLKMEDAYISAEMSVGGICAFNDGKIENCEFKGSIVGKVTKGEASFKSGGICAGNTSHGKIINCINYGKIEGALRYKSNSGIGGICGTNIGNVSKCVNQGEISNKNGSDSINLCGGICGQNANQPNATSGDISNSYNEGTVSNGYGICAQNDGKISWCYTQKGTVMPGTEEKVYHLSETADTECAMTAADFASGKVTYLLNQEQESTVWYQNIDSGTADSYPVLDSSHGIVYASQPCAIYFSNDSTKVGTEEHSIIQLEGNKTKHTCKKCKEKMEHSPTFTGSANTVTGKCRECQAGLGSFTLNAPDADTLTYNGTAKEASVSGTITCVTEPTISYSQINENGTKTSLGGKPTNVGEYEASISCGEGANTATAYVTYRITETTPFVKWSDTSETTVSYTGNSISSDKLPALTVTGVGNTDIKSNYDTDDITYFYRKSDDDTFTKGLPEEIGTYEIKATVKAKGNYTEVTTSNLTLTIDWLNTTETATLKDQNGKSLTDDDWAQSVTFTAPDGYTISWDADEKDAYGSCISFSNHEKDTDSDGILYTYYLKKMATGEIAKKTQTVRIDRTAPTFPENGGITIGDTGTWWKSLLNTVTFGLAYRNTVEVKVCGTDALSGVDKYYYYIDESGNTTPKTASELTGLTFQSVDAVGSNTVTVTTLANTGDTKNYVVYAYAVDKAGNRSAYICSNGVVVDAEAPTLTLSTPTKDDETLTDSSAKFTLNASEAGTYFYILKKDGEAAPSGMDAFATETSTNGKTTWTAKDGIASGSMAEGNNTITLTDLDANTKYTLYVVAVDSVGNETANVQSKAFTTLKLNPTITVQPKITGTYGQKLSEMNLTDGTAAYNDTTVTGTWEITDTKKATAYPTVGGTTAYEVTFKPADTDTYETITVKVIPTVAKATPYIATAPIAAGITYGETLGSSALTGGTVQYSDSDTASVEGNFVWKIESTIPKVSDSNTTSYTVIFKPTASDNYNEVETKITLTVNKAENAPNMPGSTMSVANRIAKVWDVTLPSGWVWQESDKDTPLEIEAAQSATALYEGVDKGNYENPESVKFCFL